MLGRDGNITAVFVRVGSESFFSFQEAMTTHNPHWQSSTIVDNGNLQKATLATRRPTVEGTHAHRYVDLAVCVVI